MSVNLPQNLPIWGTTFGIAQSRSGHDASTLSFPLIPHSLSFPAPPRSLQYIAIQELSSVLIPETNFAHQWVITREIRIYTPDTHSHAGCYLGHTFCVATSSIRLFVIMSIRVKICEFSYFLLFSFAVINKSKSALNYP